MSHLSLKTYIIILNYRGWRDTIECLESIFHLKSTSFHVVVVDNDSDDDSLAKVAAWAGGELRCPPSDIRFRELFNPPIPTPIRFCHRAPGCLDSPGEKDKLTLIQSPGNLGFAAGNNIGIRYAVSQSDCDFVWVLNNDTIVAPDSLSQMLDFFANNSSASLIGPKVVDMKGACWQWPLLSPIKFSTMVIALGPLRKFFFRTSVYSRFFYRGDSPERVYSIQGCSMLFRTSAITEISFFDENTFLFWEEHIVAERMRAKSLATFIVPAAQIWHKWNGSVGKMGARQFIESFRSEKYFLSAYRGFSLPSMAALSLIRVAAYFFRFIFDFSYRKNFRFFIDALLARAPKNG